MSTNTAQRTRPADRDGTAGVTECIVPSFQEGSSKPTPRIMRLPLTNGSGLHARAASQLVMLARRFQAEVSVELNAHKADAKSLLALMLLGAEKGSEVTVTVSGEEATEAADEIRALFDCDFGEWNQPASRSL